MASEPFEPHAVIYPNVEIGNDCIIATSAVIKSHTKIGKHSIFGTLSNSEGSVEIGSWTTIQSQCHLGEGTRIGNNCFIGPLFMAINTKKTYRKFGYPNIRMLSFEYNGNIFGIERIFDF